MPDPHNAPRRITVGLAAGGTGGHLFPAEALARELLRRGHDVVIYTERRGAQFTRALDGLPHVVLPARSLAGGAGGKLAAAAVIARATLAARADMKRRGVRLLAGFGGYPSFAPALAARSLGLPLLLHEQGTRLSMANRQLLRFATRVATSFPGIAGIDAGRVVETGNPVRAEILAAAGAPYPSLDAGAPLRLLVVGGSQGAAVFGRVVPAALLALPETLRRRLQVALQYRGDDAATVAADLQAAGIDAEVRPFFDDMAARLRDAHLVLTRAGATTIADLLVVGRPAIFVPIPQGGSREEQRGNADALERLGAGWSMPEPDMFTAETLSARLMQLFADAATLPRAAAAAAALGRPDAAARLADVVEALLRSPVDSATRRTQAGG
ncbi:UDP-N-acetylglucosamine--N-acetylmuramyl-(pentapeptide) pyrophosphoryl-undecaprenol N-acetylglucosamine transferase [Luteimonas sp. MC1572]|uniref:UDP-N-acetylglucosamine--N-acetylmuramyl- (pentapeptide) pyrophosphoryl-undecaprenol N-acetylglucosamine transferase n=1 Tax=Luteimonas sp. MC1572 TaxID=2799325 RepID=UPI0018F0FC2B|nr:UDP-N-acetylglucosamine--N-acetylmuramyl-(pentapeptide) pyrophosphoryl-undecaprenol N-acetylglucosamine transferase [Luteimonas sp. MC1572]MBJ6982323.1 UDP-N-acetylglucosamine--N-acetylmuramyl-(pentapeptide) pyrophosphoryl-undecaprenol N-acetylglucosamine transferase [Luteimonas sp. MC1572]QQO03592.1 UDP-N-acetylglucosamine--N-acetylmuramyl-(pentapeptide) pyrophosphoryl-undecaprenol N-acetylglucosamine transferase [Luteimonas sp. MC1572]